MAAKASQREQGFVPDLSIVIVTYDSAKDIVPCLDSIERTKGDLDIEIIVVDNASTDGTVAEVRRRFPSVQIIANAQNVGFPRANNQALQITSGDTILLLNPDTVVHEGALSALIRFFRQRRSKQIVGLNIRNGDGSRQNSAHPLPSAREFLFYSLGLSDWLAGFRYFNYDQLDGLEIDQVTRVGWVSGAAFAFNREVLDTLRGLDEDLFWVEDFDFCYRANQVGIPVYFFPDSLVTHHVGKSGATNAACMVFHQHVSKVQFFRKHYGWVACKVLEIALCVELCMKLLVRSIQLVSLSKRAESRDRIPGYVAVLAFLLNRTMPEWREKKTGPTQRLN